MIAAHEIGISKGENGGTFLPPIQKPKGPMMKLGYYFVRRKFGTIFTPMSVFSARMPSSFNSFYGKVSQLDRKLILPRETALLIREQVARINGCLFCMDATRYAALEESEGNREKLIPLAEYPHEPCVRENERAVLDYVTELTESKRVAPETFDRLKCLYSEREICEIVYLVATEHLYNLNNIGLNIGSDGLCQIRLKRK